MGTPTRFKKNLVEETQNLLNQLISNRTQIKSKYITGLGDLLT
jgi:hypothetical protein